MMRSMSARSSGSWPMRFRPPFLRMHVHVGARDVQIAAQDERLTRVVELRRVRVEGFEKAHLGRKILAAVGHVNRRDRGLRHDRTVTMRFS